MFNTFEHWKYSTVLKRPAVAGASLRPSASASCLGHAGCACKGRRSPGTRVENITTGQVPKLLYPNLTIIDLEDYQGTTFPKAPSLEPPKTFKKKKKKNIPHFTPSKVSGTLGHDIPNKRSTLIPQSTPPPSSCLRWLRWRRSWRHSVVWSVFDERLGPPGGPLLVGESGCNNVTTTLSTCIMTINKCECVSVYYGSWFRARSFHASLQTPSSKPLRYSSMFHSFRVDAWLQVSYFTDSMMLTTFLLLSKWGMSKSIQKVS